MTNFDKDDDVGKIIIMIVSPAFKDETVRVEVPEMFAMN